MKNNNNNIDEMKFSTHREPILDKKQWEFTLKCEFYSKQLNDKAPILLMKSQFRFTNAGLDNTDLMETMDKSK